MTPMVIGALTQVPGGPPSVPESAEIGAVGKGVKGGGKGRDTRPPAPKTAEEKQKYLWRATEEERKGKCDHPGCGKKSHAARTCFVKHPHLKALLLIEVATLRARTGTGQPFHSGAGGYGALGGGAVGSGGGALLEGLAGASFPAPPAPPARACGEPPGPAGGRGAPSEGAASARARLARGDCRRLVARRLATARSHPGR